MAATVARGTLIRAGRSSVSTCFAAAQQFVTGRRSSTDLQHEQRRRRADEEPQSSLKCWLDPEYRAAAWSSRRTETRHYGETRYGGLPPGDIHQRERSPTVPLV